MQEKTFGFIGAGRMATAITRGLIDSGLARPERVLASDPSAAAAEHFEMQTGAKTSSDNTKVATASDVLFLAVKPQHVHQVMAGLRGELTDRQLVISIVAGTRLDALAAGFGSGPRYVRVMPNTPCLVGRGASAYCLGSGAGAEDAKLVGSLLSAVGVCYEVEERLLDAVTGLSGSGPAFVFVIIEALSDGGVRMGLPRDVATGLAAQTVRGAAEMLLATGDHPGKLKDQVSSPGGTTIAGLEALEQAGLRHALLSAVAAATRRSIELGSAETEKE